MLNYIYKNREDYIRLELLPHEGMGPGSMAVLEVWPPYNCSIVHNHGEAYGIIKVDILLLRSFQEPFRLKISMISVST